MLKTYITVVPFQGKKDLQKVFYEPDGFELKYKEKVSFPIIPIIAEGEEYDAIKIIAIRADNKDVSKNYDVFLKELEKLGISKDKVCDIAVDENQSKVIGLKLLMTLLEQIPEDSLIYADITYGTKPLSAITLYAMNFIEKLKDTEVEGIYYGEIQRENGIPTGRYFLYDLTAYKYLSDIVDQLRRLEIKNPQETLQKLIDM